VTVCVIIHNMIFVSEHDDTVYDQDFIFWKEYDKGSPYSYFFFNNKKLNLRPSRELNLGG
jgi:hypothetical protein